MRNTITVRMLSSNDSDNLVTISGRRRAVLDAVARIAATADNVRRPGLSWEDLAKQMIADGACYAGGGRDMEEWEIRLDVIRATDTTRPDGAGTKGIVLP